MNMQELDSEYREKTDSELLRLAMNREQLTPEANVALSGELARRRIHSRTHLEAARLEEQDRLAENEKSIGTLGFFPSLELVGCVLGGRVDSTMPDRTLNGSRQPCS